MKRRAEKWGREFDERLTLQHIIQVLKETPNCECCNRQLDYGYSKSKWNVDSPSIDRFDSTKGYTAENISILCYRCNNVKGAVRRMNT